MQFVFTASKSLNAPVHRVTSVYCEGWSERRSQVTLQLDLDATTNTSGMIWYADCDPDLLIQQKAFSEE